MLLTSAVCPQVDEPVYEVCAGFLEGWTGFCLLVGGSGSCPSSAQGHVRGCLSGSCVFRKTLSSLSAYEWGCVPTLLVVWPEASQHWSLQAFGWGQVLVRKWWSPGRLMPMSTPQNYHHQRPCRCSEPQLFPASAAGPPILADKSGPVSDEVTVFYPWVLVQATSVCALQEWSFCFPQSCGVPATKPHWPSKTDSLGSSLPIARAPGWGARHGVQNFHSCWRTSVV